MTNNKAFRTQAYIFKRYIWLLSVLYNYKRLSYHEISDKWMHSSLNDDERDDFPKRTFRDHINAIQEIFGITIKNENKGEYRYYIENIDDINTCSLHNWMLNNFSLSNALADAGDIKDRILFQDIPSSKRWLSTIINAIKCKNILYLKYDSYNKGKIPSIELCPFFVKLYDNRWYVYGRNSDNPIMKVYAIDRIEDIALSEKTFDFEPTKTDRQNLENSFGYCIFPDIKPQKILIKATIQASHHLDSLPLHKSQQKIEEGKDFVIYKYYFSPTREFNAILRKWGKQLERISELK